MDDLKTMMDQQPIENINNTIRQFVYSAAGYGNKLKSTFVLLNLIGEGASLLISVDSGEFLSEVSDRVNELCQQSDMLGKAYHKQIFENNKIIDLLTNKSDNRIDEIQKQIEGLLYEYDAIIKALVKVRDSLPLQTQLEKEKQ